MANRHGSVRGDPPDPGAIRWSSVLLEVMSLMSLEVAKKTWHITCRKMSQHVMSHMEKKASSDSYVYGLDS